MNAVDNFCSSLIWMTASHRVDIVKNLKKEEEEKRNRIDNIIQEMARKEMENKNKELSSSSSFFSFVKVEREAVIIPSSLIACCILDGAGYALFQGASFLFFGMFLGSVFTSQDVRKERTVLLEEKKRIEDQKLALKNGEFEFDKKKLNSELDGKKAEHQKIITQLQLFEIREEDLRRPWEN